MSQKVLLLCLIQVSCSSVCPQTCYIAKMTLNSDSPASIQTEPKTLFAKQEFSNSAAFSHNKTFKHTHTHNI